MLRVVEETNLPSIATKLVHRIIESFNWPSQYDDTRQVREL
jgi:hypothetical protein